MNGIDPYPGKTNLNQIRSEANLIDNSAIGVSQSTPLNNKKVRKAISEDQF